MMALPVWEVHAFFKALNREAAISNSNSYSATAIAFGAFPEEIARQTLNAWSEAIQEKKPRPRITPQQAANNVKRMFAKWSSS